MNFEIKLNDHELKMVFDGINDSINKLSFLSQSINSQCKVQFEEDQKKKKMAEKRALKKQENK
jgi:hypothetical protein